MKAQIVQSLAKRGVDELYAAERYEATISLSKLKTDCCIT